MREAPNWFYKPSMAELAFILRCVEFEGIECRCSILLHPMVAIKEAREVDMLERVAQQSITPGELKMEKNQLSFFMQPYEIKSIMVITRVPLEEE